MLKWLNRLLRDDDDFSKDANLNYKITMHNYFLQELIALERQILPAKIKYLFKNKKKYLLKLLIQGIIILSVVFGILFVAWFLGFRYTPDPVSTFGYKSTIIYVTDGTDTAYIRYRMPKAKIIMMYPPDPDKDWNAYKHEMHARFESPGPDSSSYFARRWETNKDGTKYQSQYWGRYQLGTLARKDCGIGDMTWEEFSMNPEIQEGAFKAWIRILYTTMLPYIDKYDGKFIGGYHITASGIVSMAHNVGVTATIEFLKSNGAVIPADSSAPAIRFLSLGGYDLSSVTNNQNSLVISK